MKGRAPINAAMFTVGEFAETYSKYDDNKIIQLAKDEGKELLAEVVPVLEHEIRKRGLGENLIEWIRLERNFFQGEELRDLKEVIRRSQCAECGVKGNGVRGFHIRYYSVGELFDAELVVCEACGKRLKRKSYLTTATLGLLSLKAIVNVPAYFIRELIGKFSREKTSERVVDNFVFRFTGLIRERGVDEIHEIIGLYNGQQRARSESVF